MILVPKNFLFLKPLCISRSLLLVVSYPYAANKNAAINEYVDVNKNTLKIPTESNRLRLNFTINAPIIHLIIPRYVKRDGGTKSLIYGNIVPPEDILNENTNKFAPIIVIITISLWAPIPNKRFPIPYPIRPII